MRPLSLLLAGAALLLGLAFLSLMIGQFPIAPGTVMDALLRHDPLQAEHVIVTSTRLSRTVIAIAAGACLAVAGVLMQALTRNPLASPGLFGVNAGAILAIVTASTVWGVMAPAWVMSAAFVGAALTGTVVYVLGSTHHGGPARIVLAGAAVTALCTALTQAMLVIDQEGLDSLLFWLAGSTAARDLSTVAPLLPVAGAGVLLAAALARDLDVLATGDQIAAGLGQHTGRVKLFAAIAVVASAGTAVAMAGSIGFVGLIVPQMCRRLVGAAHRWLVPASALTGAALLLAADIVARVAVPPQEVPIGVLTALIGAPLFIAILRRGLHARA